MAELIAISPLALRRDGGPAASMAGAALAVREVEGLSLWLLTLDADHRPDLRATLEAALGAPSPSPDTPSSGRLTAIWQSPNDYLLFGPAPDAADVMRDLSAALARETFLLDDASHSMVVLELSGPAATVICPPPPRSPDQAPRSAVGRLAGLRVTKLFDPGGVVRLFVEDADADYLWPWLEDRRSTLDGERLWGIGPEGALMS